MKNRIFIASVMSVIMLTGCGNVADEVPSKESVTAEIAEENLVSGEEDKGTTEDLAIEVVEETAAKTVPTEQTQPKETQKTESKKTEQKKTHTDTPAITTPTVSETVVATPESKEQECQHWYQPVETESCTYIEKMVWACNGCGYALFDISSTDYSPINFPNMYVHPPCETDRFDEPCCGGGYHSEAYYYWEGCYECHTPIILRSCTTFHVMAERCIQNESNFGPYEKVETGHAYIKSCDCGKNLMVISSETGKGLLVKKEICSYCGDTKSYP